MNYQEQSRQEHPFRGLSRDEKKRLFAYMSQLAHPCFSVEDIIRKWGDDIGPEDRPTVFEALELAETIREGREEVSNQRKLNVRALLDAARRIPVRGWITIIWIMVRIVIVTCGDRLAAMRAFHVCQVDPMWEAGKPRTEFFRSGVKCANQQDLDPLAQATRPKDFMTLDVDPDGSQTVAWGEAHDLPYDRNTVAVLNVFGRTISRERLKCTEEGRELLRIAEQQRKGHRRTFGEAIKDWRVSDVPFTGLFVSVPIAYNHAIMIAEPMGKIQRGEEVIEDELISVRLYMAKKEYASQGTLGSKIGDIVRQMPGLLIEVLVLI